MANLSKLTQIFLVNYDFNKPKTTENDLRMNTDTFNVSEFRKVLENCYDIVTKRGKRLLLMFYRNLQEKCDFSVLNKSYIYANLKVTPSYIETDKTPESLVLQF